MLNTKFFKKVSVLFTEIDFVSKYNFGPEACFGFVGPYSCLEVLNLIKVVKAH